VRARSFPAGSTHGGCPRRAARGSYGLGRPLAPAATHRMPALPFHADGLLAPRRLQSGGVPGGGDGGDGNPVDQLQSQWGWDFMLMVVLLFVLYCIGGFLRNGAGGMHSLPHASFWQSLPQLVADGVRFTLGQRTHADMLNNRDGRRYSRSSAGRGGPHRDDYAPIGEPQLAAARSSTNRDSRSSTNRGMRSSGSGGRKYSMPTEEDRQPRAAALGAAGDPDEDEWRNRKTKDTRREEREERERRVAAWVHSGGMDAHWMLGAEDRGAPSNGGMNSAGVENVAPQRRRPQAPAAPAGGAQGGGGGGGGAGGAGGGGGPTTPLRQPPTRQPPPGRGGSLTPRTIVSCDE
jgi:hypothetical protein